VTNFTGNAVATVLVGSWTGEFDKNRAERVLSGVDRFDEEAFAAGDDHGGAWDEELAELEAANTQQELKGAPAVTATTRL
jgi:hypothetical protein